MPRPPVERAFSAGGVVWRRGGGGIEVVVCSRTRERVVCLPKGTPEPGESQVATALREVAEETGLEVEAGPELGAINYWFARPGSRVHKTVRWWLMQATGGDTSLHDAEFDDVRWVSIADAMATLSYADERGIVEKALHLIETRQPA
jgi:8-oxo-dGTP diphosphatase